MRPMNNNKNKLNSKISQQKISYLIATFAIASVYKVKNPNQIYKSLVYAERMRLLFH